MKKQFLYTVWGSGTCVLFAVYCFDWLMTIPLERHVLMELKKGAKLHIYFQLNKLSDKFRGEKYLKFKTTKKELDNLHVINIDFRAALSCFKHSVYKCLTESNGRFEI